MLVYSNDMGGMLSQEEIDKLIKNMEEEKEPYCWKQFSPEKF